MSVSGISSSNVFAPLNSAANQSKSQQIRQDFLKLGQDLTTGKLSAAQSDLLTLRQDFQQGSGVSTHRFHHLHQHGGPILEDLNGQQNGPATLFGELGQELQSGNIAAAKQTYTSLQQDFLQFVSGGSSTSSTGSAAGATSAALSVSA